MYIGVDCGTQSTKVVVVDVERGVILGEGSRPHRLDEGEHGRREQAPAEWLAALKGAFFQAIERAGIDAKQVRGIGVSGQQHGMVALDADGVPVYPAKLWCDTETSAQNSALVETLGARRAAWRSWAWCCKRLYRFQSGLVTRASAGCLPAYCYALAAP